MESWVLERQRLDAMGLCVELASKTQREAYLEEVLGLGFVLEPTHPPMGPSAALRGAGNSAPVQTLAAGLQKSPVDGPMQASVVRSGLVRWQ